MSDFPYPPQPGQVLPGRDPRAPLRGGLASSLGLLLGSALVGLAGGFAWGQFAPRVSYVLVSRGSADVVNPETTAFIVGDAWYCLVAVIGGAVIGLAGYLLAVRRYGPAPMAAVLIGSVVAGFIARAVGQGMGLSQFNSALLTSRPGAVLHAPPVLGADPSTILWSAIAFWPLAACLVAGGLLVLAAMRSSR
ncbi:MAG TPA: hypothetical protein VNF47_28125 [Streptosporangiaceae bacterium]|nr:hypothetical protein [Streptosporangiaceae bacterium]